MAKNLKLTIKNTQIAEAINLGSLKKRLSKQKEPLEKTEEKPHEEVVSKASPSKAKVESDEQSKVPKEETPRIKARSKSAFAEGAHPSEPKTKGTSEESIEKKEPEEPASIHEEVAKHKPSSQKTSEELRKEIFGDDLIEKVVAQPATPKATALPPSVEPLIAPPPKETPSPQIETAAPKKHVEDIKETKKPTPAPQEKLPEKPKSEYVKLGPTGRHVKDLLPQPKPTPKKEAPQPAIQAYSKNQEHSSKLEQKDALKGTPKEVTSEDKNKTKVKNKVGETVKILEDEELNPKRGTKTAAKVKEFRDVKPAKRTDSRTFDTRDRHGLRDSTDEDRGWRKKRKTQKIVQEDTTIRPSELTIRVPILIKDLASEMKLKASQLIAKLFLQGVIVTLNDILEDETTIQLLGQEFGCEIKIDTSEEQRIRITDKTIKEEILTTDPEKLLIRSPVVAFMGHVDHGKTSLIDTIRKSNRASGEAGAITQHIGAFRCSTPVGDIAILDTPGHEAFSAMRARGADVTDIVVLVVAGDEGIRQQTLEAIQHAIAAKVTIVVAINKSDKPNYNPENVYRQLAENDLLPEAWGGQIITVNCSAVTGEGIQALLEMLALQAEILELKADPSARARGRVLESEMHKGMGAVTTVLVQNGTLKLGDSLVFDQHWGRVKTMRNEYGQLLQSAGPSTPVEITGLSGLPEAGQEFIVVKNEKEAREIAEVRMQGMKQSNLLLKKKLSVENLFEQASEVTKKVLNIVLRGDVQGSVEALKVALMKIESNKAELNIIFSGVGEVTESDVELAAASKAIILGFHTQVEGHAEALIKETGVQVRMHDIIYHAIDDVKVIMKGLLDKIAQETEKGKALVKAIFKSSQHGIIAGCQVTEGSIHRNNSLRVIRDGTLIAKCPIVSLKRVKEDVREVQKGLECGIVLANSIPLQENDILEAYEITYITQEL